MGRQPHRRPTRTVDRALGDLPTTVHEARAGGWTRRRNTTRCASATCDACNAVSSNGLRTSRKGSPHGQSSNKKNLDRARAAALMCKRAAISHQSAAIAHGVPTYGDLARSCLTVPASIPLRRLAKVHLHRATMSEMDLVLIGGHSVTVAARTVMDPHTRR